VNFYLAAPPFELSASALGSIFVVYLLAVVVTPRTGHWVRRLGRRARVIRAVVGWCVGLLITLIPWLPAIIAGFAITSVSGFACQATATGLLAQRAGSARSSALGLYVTCYYLGGTAPALIWARAGWPGCVALVIVVLAAMGRWSRGSGGTSVPVTAKPPLLCTSIPAALLPAEPDPTNSWSN